MSKSRHPKETTMSKWERVEEDSPERCQATIPTRGQCINKRMDGSDYCPAHGGNRGHAKMLKAEKQMYQLGKYQVRVDDFKNHGDVKSLRSEIGILRMVLENRMKQCTDEHTLMLHSQSISNMVVSIEKLVTSCQRIDTQLGSMLDEAKAMQWMTEIVDILSHYVKDSVVLEEISNEILAAYERLATNDSVPDGAL